MGRDVPAVVFSREDRKRYRHKVRRDLEAFARMLRAAAFEGADRPEAGAQRADPLVGIELELNLVDDDCDPAMTSAAVLDALDDPHWQTELAQFNIEVDLRPRHLAGRGLRDFEHEMCADLARADAHAADFGARTVSVGILPTLQRKHLGIESLCPKPRYALLNEQILSARGEDIHIAISGVERLSTYADSITTEAACTSVQFHVQVSPEAFPRYWNAAQAVAGVQVALGANAPFLFGKELWPETRIPLFEQAIDMRPDELREQGVRPRVWFGERWITSVFDLFEENIRYFPPLLPICEDEDPLERLEAGEVPLLPELTLHNGTIYRWNRPVYAVEDGTPHLRVENRVLPAGPTVVDIVANAAFYFGVIRALVEAERPVWTRMSFAAATENFQNGARHGIDAVLYWPGAGDVPATELVLRRLLPLAYDGLDLWGVDPAERDRLLGVIEQRCLTGCNGAAWQADVVHRIQDGGEFERLGALREMTRRYVAHMQSNEPVHTWPLS